MTKILQLFCFVSALSLLPAANVSAVGNTREDGEVPAFSAKGKTTIQTAEALVDVHLTDGTPSKGDSIAFLTRRQVGFSGRNPRTRPTPLSILFSRAESRVPRTGRWSLPPAPAMGAGTRNDVRGSVLLRDRQRS